MDGGPTASILSVKDEITLLVSLDKQRLEGLVRVAVQANVAFLVILNLKVQVRLVSHPKHLPIPVNVSKLQGQGF